MLPKLHLEDAEAPRSLADRAYLSIREGILRGRFPVGSRLSRRKLAVALGMSHLPVSEALQRLEADGIVETKSRSGTRVSIPTAKNIRDSYVLREALESQAARLFVSSATPAQKAQLRRMAERTDVLFKACVGWGTSGEFLYEVHTCHFQYHMFIAECSGCEALCSAFEKNQVLIFNWLFDVTIHHQARPERSHRDLAEILCEGGVKAADAAMRTHIQYGLDEIIQAIESRTPEQWLKTRIPGS